MILRPHQQRFVDVNPDRAMLYWTPRAGKSLAAARWSESISRSGRVVVVCKKSNKKEWQRYCRRATVFTKEEFKKYGEIISECSAIIVDEIHHHLAPLHITKERSAQAEALYNFLRKHRPHFLGLSGTPMTNKPASVHTLLTYLGVAPPWKEFQKQFYSLEFLPYLPRPAWMPKKGWRAEAQRLLEQHTDVVTLEEIAPYLPEEIHEVIKVKAGKYAYGEDEERCWTKDHRAEQYNKAEAIRGLELRKAIIVCKYTEQIEDLANKLKRDKPVYILNGQTKNQEQTIKDAQDDPSCYLIVQAAMGEGYNGHQFDAMVFASMDHRFISYQQMKARLVSLDHPKPRVYYYLLSDGKFDVLIHSYVVKDGVDAPTPQEG